MSKISRHSLMAAVPAAALATAPVLAGGVKATPTAIVQAEAIPRRRPAARPAELPVFVQFKDLRAAGIVSGWGKLARLIAEEGFPQGRWLGANSRRWTMAEVMAWLESRPTDGKGIDDETKQKLARNRRGRRRRVTEEESATA